MEAGKSAGRGKKKQARDTTGTQITLKMTDTDSNKEFIITMVYAKCDAIERIELWDTLYSLASDMSLPWLVGGDFNVIWDEEEKFGGLPVHINEIDDFRHCISTCSLFDLGFKGSIFTWWNGRAEEDCIQTTGQMFRFYFQANPFILFNHKMKKLKKSLSIWSKVTFGDIFKQIASLEEVVKVHETQFELNPSVENRARLQRVQADLIRVWALEEDFWKQKAGLAWFKDGDRNIKLFHIHVKGKRRKLQLKRIQDRHGMWVEEEEKLAEEAVHFYQQQFHESAIPTDFRILEMFL
ncbi:PREDICTED: uncharacterized protein LOC109231720 [Nicotiana attenuata]|uniref:uncharacterized protein LOC109231720 n=1 Tax=Nicotiana attenuata TaxID=49451 RepID=UPI0009056676|nr:PREDICTED: uncharacterized protein LOC109231720 [Nicotiana attenuata]